MVRIRKVRVFALAVPIAFVAVAGSALADPLLAEAMGLDVWHVGQLERDLRMSRHVDIKLESELQSIMDRSAVHNLMLDDLVAARITLVEAAREKWEKNRDRAVLRDHLDRNRSGPSMEAKMAHDLIVAAFGRDGSDELNSRLRSEYLAAYGTALPEERR